jgi:hypothetical protein
VEAADRLRDRGANTTAATATRSKWTPLWIPMRSYFMAETGSRRAHTILTRSSSSNSCPTEVSARNAWLCIKQVTGFANSVGTRIAALAFSGLQSARFGVKEAEQIRTKAVSMWARMHNAYHSQRAPIARPREKAPSKRGQVSPYCGKTGPGSLGPGQRKADALRERPRGAEASRFHAGENEKAPRRSGAGGRKALLQKSSSSFLPSSIETGVVGDGWATEPVTTGSSSTG